SGLVTFGDARLAGGQTVTVTRAGYAAATWIGVGGAVATVPLTPTRAPRGPRARVSRTIQGWSAIPNPAPGHYLLAIALGSGVLPLSDPQNSIAQPSGSTPGVPANFCIKAAGLPGATCSWKLNARTGRQLHYAVILDGDARGTATDFSDDTYTVV